MCSESQESGANTGSVATFKTAAMSPLLFLVSLLAFHTGCSAVAVKLTLAEQEQGQGLGAPKATALGWGARVQERDKKQAGLPQTGSAANVLRYPSSPSTSQQSQQQYQGGSPGAAGQGAAGYGGAQGGGQAGGQGGGQGGGQAGGQAAVQGYGGGQAAFYTSGLPNPNFNVGYPGQPNTAYAGFYVNQGYQGSPAAFPVPAVAGYTSVPQGYPGYAAGYNIPYPGPAPVAAPAFPQFPAPFIPGAVTTHGVYPVAFGTYTSVYHPQAPSAAAAPAAPALPDSGHLRYSQQQGAGYPASHSYQAVRGYTPSTPFFPSAPGLGLAVNALQGTAPSSQPAPSQPAPGQQTFQPSAYGGGLASRDNQHRAQQRSEDKDDEARR